jgi:hypothetical protein
MCHGHEFAGLGHFTVSLIPDCEVPNRRGLAQHPPAFPKIPGRFQKLLVGVTLHGLSARTDYAMQTSP